MLSKSLCLATLEPRFARYSHPRSRFACYPQIELRSISELRATVSKVEQWQKRTEIVFPKDDESFEPIITGGLRRGVGLGIADEKDSVALFKKPLASEMEEVR